MTGAFRPWDWAVFAGYFAFLVGTGVLLARRPGDARDYFVGHRQMPSWAVAVSVLASALSVATYLGAPQEAYAGDLTYLLANVGTMLAVVVVAYGFIPAFYRHEVVTVYQLLGVRFGPRAAQAASWTFLVGRALASGARLFMAAIPAGMILTGDGDSVAPVVAGILILTAIGIAYTLVGGISSIIWTDVIQFMIMIGAVVAAVVLLWSRIPAAPADIWHALSEPRTDGPGKLALVSLSLDPTRANTLWTALGGYLLLNLAVYGTDQDLAQRMLTCRNAVAGGRAALAALVMNIPVVLLFLGLGLLLWVFYQRPDLMGGAAPAYPVPGGQKAFLAFILHEMPQGMAGLMMAGLFAIALTSLLSALNAMASAFITDCYRGAAPGRDERHYLTASRWAVAGAGVVVALVAIGCMAWERHSHMNLLALAFSVMVLACSGLLGVFLTALFTRRGNQTSAIAALVVGFATCAVLQWAPYAEFFWPDGRQLAWPWIMVIGTAAAFATCCAGTPSARTRETSL
ncbi:MAG: sodium:solute symporter [Planctomycetes bacterium]|nr:sodium:solute symporter [Planctomycetota bacterium]